MMSPILILVGWITQILACFYFVRFISNMTIRCILTMIPCIILTYMVSYDLPRLHMPSMLLVTFCWLVTIRLIHLTILSPNQCLTLRAFLLKICWMFFPMVPSTSSYQQEWPIINDFISAVVKLIMNHWIDRWLLICEGSDSYARSIMFYIFILTHSFLSDILNGILRIVTRDKYVLKSYTNFPFLSTSLREFWGRRHNQLVNTIFRESIFQPLRQFKYPATIAAMVVFLVSALLHIHLALVTFKDSRSTVSTIIFFLLHGLACTIEAQVPFQLPTLLSWFFTQYFLLATASLQNGPFTRLGPEFYALNPPPFFEQKWIPKLPVPNFCPK